MMKMNNGLSSCIGRIKFFLGKPTSSAQSNNYFQSAEKWSDDIYTAMIASRNRYQIGFYLAMLLAILLTIAIIVIVPLQKTRLVVVHQGEDGVVWVDPAAQPAPPYNPAITESEIVNYVVNRESYSADAYITQYSLVQLMSNSTVANDYLAQQSIKNKNSPVNLLGNNGTQTVHVEDVLFLDNINKNNPAQHITYHRNLAQVNFTVTTRNHQSNEESTIPYTVLLSWTYRGIPRNPNEQWKDWDGFVVTQYSLQQRSIASQE